MAHYTLQYEDLTAWISIDGVGSEVYAIEKQRPNAIACWIASESGKKFSVNWNNSTRAFALQGKVIIDGVTCDYHVMLDANSFPDRLHSIGVSFARTSEVTQRDFMFSTIQVTDDDAYLGTINRAHSFGTITLELWRLYVANVISDTLEHQLGGPVLEGQIVHERSKKAGAHHARYGQEYYSPSPVVDAVSGKLIDREPYVTFTFKYRPLPILMANGIVPRPLLSSSSSAETSAEIRHLEARLQALRSRAQTSGQSTDHRSSSRRIKAEPGVAKLPSNRNRHRNSKPPEVIDLTLD